MDTKEIARSWFANIDRKNFGALEALLDPEHRFASPMTPAPVGPKEHLGMIQAMTGAFTGEHHLELVLADGHHAVVRGRWKGRHTGTFNGIAATNNAVEFTFIDILELRNGKVGREAFEMNLGTLLQQIGAVAG